MGSDFFESSRSALAAQKKEFKSKGLWNKPNNSDTITAEMIELMWQSGELGSETGRTLQNTLVFYLTIWFGLGGCHESRQLEWGDVTLEMDSNGKEFLQFRQRPTKTRKGDRDSGSRPFAPIIFAMEGDRCAIFLRMLLRSHRRHVSLRLPLLFDT